jgi:hypothetical protein
MVDAPTAQRRLAAKRRRLQNGKKRSLLRRKEASEYLRERHGLSYAPGTLANYAARLSGPPFEDIGGIPFYRPAQLDRWAKPRKPAETSSEKETL